MKNMTGREFLNEHIQETNIPREHLEYEIGEMMDWYADYYHQVKLRDIKLDLETLKRVRFIFSPHSDGSTMCNGYHDLCRMIGELEPRCKYIKKEGESCTLNDNCKYPNCE